ncbi:MAG TPA: deoxyribodipyrimidine photo-lyase [Candidatus Saccharimonadales bacterium]|nr:deoxyribodipyrimidine photo-lyase [Candidatus Saccharimonadales bacterium]
MKTIIVWYRNDLRVADHPALAAAVAEAESVVPVFIFDPALTGGKTGSSNRNRFLLESLADLRTSLQERGADLIIRQGDAANELAQLASDTQATTVYYTQDYTPYAMSRDANVGEALDKQGVLLQGFPGRLMIDAPELLQTGSKQPYKVFTPFWKQWSRVPRRPLAPTPHRCKLPPGITAGKLPKLSDITDTATLSPQALKGGEAAAQQRLHAFIDDGITGYHNAHNNPGLDQTSRLSPYLHFGCLSARTIEDMLPEGQGADAFHRQLAWRDFYNYVLLHFPHTTRQEFQERYRHISWSYDQTLLTAWQEGRTGYPIVDAAMRQLRAEGWMHNRARLIVGSFLTKDLGLDWRLGEQYFKQWLMDGDTANNTGNWQWIAGVGVDPAPLFRRLYNPTSQQKSYDPQGVYTRRYVPELATVQDKYIAEPWKMSAEEQQAAGCVIGKDYPAPVVDHAIARQQTLERYRSAPL